jgi:hypothetical protein
LNGGGQDGCKKVAGNLVEAGRDAAELPEPAESAGSNSNGDAVWTVQVTGRFRADHGASMYAAVTAGPGIGFTPLRQIRKLVDEGQVELILLDYEPPSVPIHVVWPGSKMMPAKTGRFIDILADHLRKARLWSRKAHVALPMETVHALRCTGRSQGCFFRAAWVCRLIKLAGKPLARLPGWREDHP